MKYVCEEEAAVVGRRRRGGKAGKNPYRLKNKIPYKDVAENDSFEEADNDSAEPLFWQRRIESWF